MAHHWARVFCLLLTTIVVIIMLYKTNYLLLFHFHLFTKNNLLLSFLNFESIPLHFHSLILKFHLKNFRIICLEKRFPFAIVDVLADNLRSVSLLAFSIKCNQQALNFMFSVFKFFFFLFLRFRRSFWASHAILYAFWMAFDGISKWKFNQVLNFSALFEILA